MQQKRVRARAIILHQDKIALMYREREGDIYYTFPGGGAEKNESAEDCVKREVFEEFGIEVTPLKQVYEYENQYSVECFFVCEWVAGEFGSGKGEEFDKNQKNGVYIPKLVDVLSVPNIPLMPPEVASAFCADYAKNGKTVRGDIKRIVGEIR